MRYFLLTFTEDWADEHNVPALACFDEVRFERWKAALILEPNPNYQSEMLKYRQEKEEYEAYRTDYRTKFEDKPPLTPRDYHWIKENEKPYPRHVRKGEGLIRARLGNGGHCFEEQFEQYSTAGELIEAKIVEVTEVDEAFYNVFNKARLSRLSLSNVFEF